MEKLRVLARSSPEDKNCIVEGLQRTGSIVAVTGESHNDARALEEADVGFTMGIAGCETAKDSSDMILLNDNFASTMHAVMWGRNIYSNVRKFLQFQMTVNISSMIIVLIGCATTGETPFSIV